MPLIVGAAALASATLLPVQGEGRRASLAVEVFAFRGGKGDWGLAIEGTRVVRAIVNEKEGLSRPSLLLSEPERARLVSLVARLPKDRKRYSFGKTAPDITTDFELSVGRGAEVRVYAVGEYLEDVDDGPTLKTILEILNLLHALIGSKQASPPPPLNWRSRKQ